MLHHAGVTKIGHRLCTIYNCRRPHHDSFAILVDFVSSDRDAVMGKDEFMGSFLKSVKHPRPHSSGCISMQCISNSSGKKHVTMSFKSQAKFPRRNGKNP